MQVGNTLFMRDKNSHISNYVFLLMIRARANKFCCQIRCSGY